MKKIKHQDILKIFKHADKPLTPKEIYSLFGKKKSIQKRIKHILKELEQAGKIIATGKAFCLVNKLPVVKGILEVQKSGIGFVLPEDKRRKDIFVLPENFEDAWHGDTVLVAILPKSRGKNPEGRIVRVLKKELKQLVGRVKRKVGKNTFLIQPTDLRLKFCILVESEIDLKPQTLINLKPTHKLEPFLWHGELIEILGTENSLEVQEKLVKINHQIPTKFPQKVLEEAANLPMHPTDKDFKNRKNLTHLSFVTIDGAKAKDFDDAIYIEKKDNGYILYVAIADVSHYVDFGSSLDKQALERGNSYYFPLSVEPMFPKELSNGLCSLNPNVNRLVIVAEMKFSTSGKRIKEKFYPAVIQSKFRLTYSQVHLAIEKQDPEEQKSIKPILPMLQTAYDLAKILNQNRSARGSIDFDLPEPEILFNFQEDILEIKPRLRYFSHQVIEEFMIAANEAVAEFLEEKAMPFLYRVHPAPKEEKLENLFKLLKSTKLATKIPKDTSPKDLQTLLKQAQNTNLAFLVNRLLLRSMMQAKYSPINEGHFGLASMSYCHFTSPIRRYADLVVHRALKKALQNEYPRKKKINKLKKLGEKLSLLERKAMEAEREILKRASVLALKNKVGEEFTGVISSLCDFGFWVELEEIMAEGLVRFSSLTDDYYTFLPERQELLGKRTGKRYTLGQKVKVRLEKASLETLQLDFTIC
ncbi:RNAse R [Desulfonauticus submarinus]|uniref:Ribonuclease R n=1 Tax=Desulfonauticus submarinus TaxID=206665 RepID=A0A1H0D8Z3_9BACT|nr:ribonuclease R [Desulfonauticus submarinus]SDN66623.1 RNAse R [Desulfonauticus submarinus]